MCRGEITEEDIQSAIEKRMTARKEKDFDAADAVRLDLMKQGIALQDSPQGTNWRPASRPNVAEDQS